MSHRDVYDYEMIRQMFSDSDVECVLSGQEPESETLARLAASLVALHAEQPEAPSDETISRMAGEAAEIARSSAPDHDTAVSPAPGIRPRGARGSLRRRLVTLTAAMFVFAAMTGIAFAADGAAPGDTLYGLDRALEQVGINDGATTERIQEAKVLAANGQVPDALRHLADSVESQDQNSVEVQEAAEALRAAADNVRSGDDDSESSEVRESVAEMLEEMTDMTEAPEFDGATFGQRIAEMAKLIAGWNANGNGNGPPGDTGPPNNPGRSSAGGQGPPADSGPPDNAGPPGGTGGRP